MYFTYKSKRNLQRCEAKKAGKKKVQTFRSFFLEHYRNVLLLFTRGNTMSNLSKGLLLCKHAACRCKRQTR